MDTTSDLHQPGEDIAGEPGDGSPGDELVAAETAGGAPRRVRSIVAGFIGVLAVVGVMAGTFALWARAVLFDSDKVAVLVEEALDQPEVTAAIAREVTDLVFTAAEVDARLESVLPPALQPLGPVVSGGARVFVQERLERRLETEEARALVSALVRRSHAATLRLLEGDGLVSGVTVTDGEVTVNLLPLVGRGLDIAQGLGLLAEVEVPPLRPDGVPAEQIAALEDTFDRELPADFGQLVVYRSAALADAQASLAVAQQALVLVKRAIWVILAVTLVLLVAAVVVANDRRRAAFTLALGSVAAALVVRVVTLRIVNEAPGVAVDPAARALIRSTVDGLASGLLRMFAAIIVIGLVAAAVTFLNGPSAVARSVRADDAGGSRLALVDAHREAVAVAAFALAVVVLVLLGVGIAGIALALLLAGLGAVVLVRGS